MWDAVWLDGIPFFIYVRKGLCKAIAWRNVYGTGGIERAFFTIKLGFWSCPKGFA